MVRATEESGHKLVALLVRGDHELNEVKAEKLAQVATPLTFATEEEIRAIVGAGPGSLGPVNLPMPVVADRSVAAMSDFGAGANVDGKHYFGINWGAICRCRRWPISVTWWKATPARTVRVRC